MSVAATVSELLALLEDSGLVADADLLALRRWADDRRSGLGQVAQEVLNRDLLTRYQLKEVAGGRADRLTLGPYRLLEPLGEGGMGMVFRARHTRLGREAAVKLIRPEKLARASVVERFRQEIRAAARLAHPNVVLAFDADEAGGVHYFAMEYVPGADLARVVTDRGPLPVAEAVGYVRQAADGLQHAADLGLVHRDVKPANLLLTPDGRVKVLDLGLALLAADTEPDRRAGVIVGSPDFMAPEQARDPLAVDIRADVYALGGTLYYLLTGQPPVSGETAEEKILRHLTADPPSARAVRPEVPDGLDAVLRQMLARNPAGRPASPGAAAAALAPFGGGSNSGRYTPPAPPSTSSPGTVRIERSNNSERHTSPAAPLPTFELVADPRPAAPQPRRPRRWSLWAGLAAVVVGGVFALYLLAPRAGDGATAAAGPGRFTNPAGMTLVLVDGGEAMLGAPSNEPGRGADDQPPTPTSVRPFYIGATEVTHGQFLQIMGKSPAKWPGRLRDAKLAPVDSVTMAEAVEFCRLLSAKDAGRRANWAYRLPTEAEWEIAARGGTTTPFWAGDRLTFGESAVFAAGADSPRGAETGMPHPVGGTRANPFGLFDVSGNVWEWTAGGVLRGGSWKEPADRCRSASRRPVDPATRAEDVGFRVVFAPRS